MLSRRRRLTWAVPLQMRLESLSDASETPIGQSVDGKGADEEQRLQLVRCSTS
jgi:hypothetical protein